MALHERQGNLCQRQQSAQTQAALAHCKSELAAQTELARAAVAHGAALYHQLYHLQELVRLSDNALLRRTCELQQQILSQQQLIVSLAKKNNPR